LVHIGALKVVKITTLFESTQEKYCFFAFFSSLFFSQNVYIFDFQSFVIILIKELFLPFQSRFFGMTSSFGQIPY
jgi:hypothetical protein